MYKSTEQKNNAVNSLMKGDLNYSSHGIMTPHFPDLTISNINDLSQNDEPGLIGEVYDAKAEAEFIKKLALLYS